MADVSNGGGDAIGPSRRIGIFAAIRRFRGIPDLEQFSARTESVANGPELSCAGERFRNAFNASMSDSENGIYGMSCAADGKSIVP
jgi:hypothetical protein